MADAPMPLSSAVIVPDPVEESLPSPTSTKRRQSPFPEADAKRARLSENVTINGYGSRSPPLEENQRPGTGQKRKDQAEERKRGQRLFGALLGTLSQSSSSTAPKRRRDIEEKQTAKLRHEADEFDEKRKQRLEVLTSVRRRQQKVYDRQGIEIRHSNLLARAHFLQTNTEPKLYYKPWELRKSEEEKIKAQITEMEATVARELQEQKISQESSDQSRPSGTGSKDIVMDETSRQESDGGREDEVGSSTESVETKEMEVNDSTKEQEKHGSPAEGSMNESPPPPARITERLPDDTKDQGDDQGDLVEGDEDAVIY